MPARQDRYGFAVYRDARSGAVPPAEQHLGDRLAALVDGELKHDARERVLAHLATCSRREIGQIHRLVTDSRIPAHYLQALHHL
ncbi:zf-HC2 domain-containing protein, partial [Serratia bockelmannii]|uniref:zf-HC2 domain-containing protein n=1 Tax=Serratia bockelmannii TaxID=2703793 RepID=UPI003D00CF94